VERAGPMIATRPDNAFLLPFFRESGRAKRLRFAKPLQETFA
jgi:hypothetical protein